MKNKIRSVAAIGALCATLLSTSAADEAGFVDFGTLNPSPNSQFVEVNIKSNLIAMITALTRRSEPEVASVIEGLKQVRVNVLGLTTENREDLLKRVAGIREKLDQKGWDRIVSAVEKNQDVSVSLKTKDAKTVEGICVTVVEGDQVVLVNVIGNIQPEKLAIVGERFNIYPLKHIPSRPAPETKEVEKSKS